MSESISVGYRQLGPSYYHKFIVYTDSNGNQWATSGWAGGNGEFGSSDGSQSGSSGSGSSASDFGQIITTGGSSDPKRYDPNYPDHPKNPDGTDKYPGKEIKWEKIKEGNDLSGDWRKVTDAMDDIAREGHQYRPLDQNSNSTADEALRRSGLPEPKNDGFGDDWAPGSGNNLPGGPDDKSFWDKFKDWFDRAKNWVWPRDPIILDLDGNGLETVGLASNVFFDHDGDGVLTKTGWAGRDDALLVWDRNANGTIDTGAELFGDFTPLPNGTLAPNGFAALSALDSNGDGILDASDPAFAELKLWKDGDQNGQTGAGELISLLDAGIASLNLANALKNQRLTNGNTLAREGSFTRADGSTGGMGEFHLATDTFDTRFADPIEVPEPLKSLPNMGGAGNVRELQQAAAQSGGVAGILAQFQSAATRAEQKSLLDHLLTAWAGTSGMAKTLEERASGKYRIQYEAFGNERRSTNLDSVAFVAASSGSVGSGAGLMSDAGGLYMTERYRNLISEWSRKLHVLEAFNGQYFFNLPEKKSQTDGANWGLSISAGSGGGSGGAAMAIEAFPLLRVNFSQTQLDLLQQAYDSLKESVYASLVMQTRLKPYLDQIELVIDDAGIRLDATALNQSLAARRATDPENALADLLDLDKYAGNFLSGTNWQGLADFDTLIETLPRTAGITALLNEFKVRTLTGGDDNTGLTDQAEIVLAGEGRDTLYGYNGNDMLYGAAGADTYVFGRGFGHDTIIEDSWISGETDRIELKAGVTPGDVRLEHVRMVNSWQVSDDLKITIRDTGETLTVKNHFNESNRYAVEEIVFADGTVWNAEAIKSRVLIGEAGNDELRGFNGRDDLIDGGAGNDVLEGGSGSDTYRFGLGAGQDAINEGYTTGEDAVELAAGVTPADVTVRWTIQGDMAVILSDGSRFTVRGQSNTWSNEVGIEQLRFADGTLWSHDGALRAMVVPTTDSDDECGNDIWRAAA